MTRFVSIALILLVIFMTGCGDQKTPHDKLLIAIFDVVIYTLIGGWFIGFLINQADIELGKVGKIILFSILAIGFTIAILNPGLIPLPSLK